MQSSSPGNASFWEGARLAAIAEGRLWGPLPPPPPDRELTTTLSLSWGRVLMPRLQIGRGGAAFLYGDSQSRDGGPVTEGRETRAGMVCMALETRLMVLKADSGTSRSALCPSGPGTSQFYLPADRGDLMCSFWLGLPGEQLAS